jgi:acyl-CoA synthetase (AMP-forming)/AMP-acid ligase II
MGAIVNIADDLTEHAGRRPDHPAIIDGDRVMTYGELAPVVDRTAAHLRNAGIGEGSVVGVCLKDTADHLAVLYGLARLGAAILPMDWRWTAVEKRRVAVFFEAALIVHEPGDDLTGAGTPAALDESWHEAVAAADGGQDFPGGRDLPLVLSLSSGTTGIPKGPLTCHGHMFHRFGIYRSTFGFSGADRYLSALPLYFGGGRGMAMATLHFGGTVIMFPPPYEAAQLAAAVADTGATVTLLVPTILRRLLALPQKRDPILGGLRLLVSTGAPLHPRERRQVIDRVCPNFVNFYGTTEAGGVTVLRPEDGGAAEHSVGRPVAGSTVEIADEEDRPVPAGTVGLIRYRGGGVPAGYYKNPEASSAAFRDGWFYPGDLGRLDEAGYLYITGRTGDRIIRGGANIYVAEIEQVLLDHPAVRDAAVVAWPSPERGEEIAAFVVASDATDEADILRHCREILAPYKVPRAVFVVDDLPKSGTGKVRKPDLIARLPKLSD